MREKVKYQELGITLVALVVTIIVLLILAGVTISLVLGENGIIGKAKLAVVEKEKSEIIEELGFVYAEAKVRLTEAQATTPSYTLNDIFKDSIDTSREKYNNEIWNNVSGTVSDLNLNETSNTVSGEVEKKSGNEYEFDIDVVSGEIRVGYKNDTNTSSAFSITYAMSSNYLPVKLKVYPHVEGYQTTIVDYRSIYVTYEDFANYILGTLSTYETERSSIGRIIY